MNTVITIIQIYLLIGATMLLLIFASARIESKTENEKVKEGRDIINDFLNLGDRKLMLQMFLQITIFWIPLMIMAILKIVKERKEGE